MKRISIFAIALLTIGIFGCGKGAPTEAKPDEHAKEEAGHTEPGHKEPGHDEATHGEPGHEEPGHKEPGAEEAGHKEDIVLTAAAAKIAGIEVQDVRRMMMQGELKVPGIISSTSLGKAVVTPSAPGQIMRVFVRVGQLVKAGQPIATVRSSDLAEASAGIIQAQRGLMEAQADAKGAKAQVDLANSKHRTAQQLLQRQLAFAKTGAFSQPALQAAQKDLADAESELERGKQDQAVHEAQLERAERLFKQELISRTELEQARLEVASDKIRQSNAERKIVLAKATYDRERTIADRGLANSREIQAAEAEVRSAYLEVQQAKIRLTSANSGIASARKGVQAARTSYQAQAGTGRASGGALTVTAPISGVIVDLEATLGQAVERTTEICEIENLNTVLVVANVADKQIGLARLGGPAQLSVSAYPNRVFRGVVQSIGNRLDPKTRTMPVHVLVENRDGALRAGMFTTVSLGVGANAMTLAVPTSAIVDDGDLRKLYIAEDGGKYEEKIVVLGRTSGNFIEVLEGLEPGAKVVVKGAFVLKSEKVKAELKGHEH